MTAFVTGTATDQVDLFDKFIDFLTANVDLVSASENWSVVWQAQPTDPNPTDIMLSGPGLSSSDEILVSFRLNNDPTNDLYSISICGHTGIIPTATEFNQHVGSSFTKPRMFLEDIPMEYWFVANGRRFSAVVKVSTVYESMYGGFFLPYAPPTNYSYPLLIGASAPDFDSDGPLDWRSTHVAHTHFPYGRSGHTLPGSYEATTLLIDPMGQWIRCTGAGSSSDGQVGIGPSQFFPDLYSDPNQNSTSPGYESIRQRIRSTFDGSHILTPFTLVQRTPANQTYGILHGVYHVTGRDNAAENIITVGGVDHLVVPNAFRSGFGDYWALALE